MDKKKIPLIVMAIISGLLSASFALYLRSGRFGQTEIIAISITAVIAILIPIILYRKKICKFVFWISALITNQPLQNTAQRSVNK